LPEDTWRRQCQPKLHGNINFEDHLCVPYQPIQGFKQMAQDWEMSGDIFTIETAHDEVHVFWNR
jgi:hypothetical protein